MEAFSGRYLFLFLLSFALSSAATSMMTSMEEPSFSGVYFPNITYNIELYAGAWLISKKRFLSSINQLRDAENCPGVTFAVLNKGQKTRQDTIMTRDYLDFSVVHLSSLTNEPAVVKSKMLQNVLMNRMDQTIRSLREHAAILNMPSSEYTADYRLRDETVCVVAFSTSFISTHGKPEFQGDMRVKYLQATVWSLVRYMPHVIVSVGKASDYELVNDLQLPVMTVLDLSSKYQHDLQRSKTRKADGHPYGQPRDSLLYVYDMMTEGEGVWGQFKRIYYTEGDHVLYMRSQQEIMDVFDFMHDETALIPHRLQTLALPKAFERFPLARNEFSPSTIRSLADTELVTEDMVEPVGSCCDNGRHVFANCGTWWHRCEDIGRRNYTTWLRFGRAGFTFPAGTAHQARCTYSAQKVMCDLPEDCRYRVPAAVEEICTELPNVEFTH